MTSDFLQQLSDSQREAAQNYNGAALIIAGAGSGKTRVLTYRIAHMIREGVRPYSILALTFTNKAASEMRERIAKVVDKEKADMIWMGTFHSIFARILRKEAEHLGFSSNFTIYDSADSQNLIKNIVKEKNLNDEKYKPRSVASRISLAKNNLVTPAAYSTKSTLIAEDREMGIPQFLDVYKEYMMRCKRNNAMDFDDLLLYTNILFRDNEQVLTTYQKKFTYILVDEYQDTNMAQYLIIKKIAEMFGNIAVVGDDAQSIYSFRGAKVENILKFQADYPDSKTYKLEQNYRSTQTIVNAANSVIENNSNRLKKVSFSKGEMGDKIKVYKLYTDKEEAINVANDIKNAMNSEDAKSYKDFAILYRTNAQSRTFEEALRQRSIPYKIHGGFSFYQRTEIKNMLAYARVLVNGSDNEALMRIVNFPTRGLGDVTLARISDYAREASITVYETLYKIATSEVVIKGVAQNKIAIFMQIMSSLSKIATTKDAYETMYEIAYGTGIMNLYKETKSIENQSALQNIEELLNSLKQISDQKATDHDEPMSLVEWLESVVLITSDTDDESDDKVTLMTIHSAKGLEFDSVFIVGMEEGLFPLEGSAGSLADIEEERRLFYVAITRAVSKLTISLCQNRYKWGKSVSSNPSRFMKEIDSSYLEVDDCQEQYSNIIKRAYEPDSVIACDSGEGRKPYNPVKKAMPIANRTPVKYEQRTAQEPAVDMSRFKRVKSPNAMRSDGSGSDSSAISDIKVGSNVVHGLFGTGVVVALEPTSTDTKATIEFSNVGKKTLLLKFAKLKSL